jgi:hypothetical protein
LIDHDPVISNRGLDGNDIVSPILKYGLRCPLEWMAYATSPSAHVPDKLPGIDRTDRMEPNRLAMPV